MLDYIRTYGKWDYGMTQCIIHKEDRTILVVPCNINTK